MKALALLPVLLCSCMAYEHTAISKSGNQVHDKILAFGGTASHRSSDGSSTVYDAQQSARDFFATAGLAIGAYQAVKVNASNNAAASSQAAQQTAREANARTPTIVNPVETSAGPLFPQVVPPATAIVPKP